MPQRPSAAPSSLPRPDGDAVLDLSVIIVNCNTHYLLDPLFSRIEAAGKGLAMQLLVVDNASTDGSAQALAARRLDEGALILGRRNIGFGRANNLCLPRVSGRYVLVLNSDAFVAEDSLRSTIAWMDAHPQHGILGARLIGRDGAVQPSCRSFPTPLNLFLRRAGLAWLMPWVRLVDARGWDSKRPADCDWVPACFYLIRREVLRQIGLFDPRFFMYYEDVDHCRRAKAAGWRVAYFPGTKVIHIGGESAKSQGPLDDEGQLLPLKLESELLYLRKHHGLAGLLLHLMLVGVGDGILAVKRALGRLFGRAALAQPGMLRQCLRVLRDTRWGTVPTR